MSANRVTVIVVAVAVVAIVALLTLGGDEESTSEPRPAATTTEEEKPAATTEEKAAPVPDNPDQVRGTDSFALTRPANLRRALAVLDERRRGVEGVFDGLRVAPGRIDTVIVHPDDRRTNIQVRADLSVPFEFTHDFPTQAGFRKGGLTAREVDVEAPARLLRAIDRQRSGSAARDVDYLVIRKGIIDFEVGVAAYMRIRTPRPRYFRMEGERAVAIG